MNDKKVCMTDYYVEFLEQVNESTIKAFSSTAQACGSVMEAIFKHDHVDAKSNALSRDLSELKEIYINTLEHLKKMMKPIAGSHPDYDEIADLAVASAGKGFDACSYWYSLIVEDSEKIGQLTRSNLEFFSRLASPGSLSKPDKFFEEWTQISSWVLNTLSDSSASMNAISGFVARFTDFIKSNLELQRKILKPAFVTRKEFAGIAEEVNKIKLILEKRLKEPVPGEPEKTAKKQAKGKK